MQPFAAPKKRVPPHGHTCGPKCVAHPHIGTFVGAMTRLQIQALKEECEEFLLVDPDNAYLAYLLQDVPARDALLLRCGLSV